MEWHVPPSERTYLRSLARKQAEYAALPVMAQRKRMWYDLNDGRPGARPPVVIETWTFDRDFLPADTFRCTTEAGRAIERQLLRNIRNHELIDDDKVMPETFDIGWFVEIDEMGVAIDTERVRDAEGVETGYRFLHPIVDLERDLDLLQPAVCRVDRQRTMAWKAFVADVIANSGSPDALPVRIRTGSYGSTMLTHRIVELMGMQAFLMATYDSPDALHRLMGFLRDNALRGTEIVFSRKPDPNYLSVDVQLDETAWAAHIRETLAATRDVSVEFIVRDVYTVHGNLDNARRGVGVARREIERHYRP